jgi:hypothetical protein
MCFDAVLLAQVSGMARSLGFVVNERETQIHASLDHLGIPPEPRRAAIPLPVRGTRIFLDGKTHMFHLEDPTLRVEVPAVPVIPMDDFQQIPMRGSHRENEVQYEMDKTLVRPVPTPRDECPE